MVEKDPLEKQLIAQMQEQFFSFAQFILEKRIKTDEKPISREEWDEWLNEVYVYE